MADNEFLSLDEWLSIDDRPVKVFESKIWGKKDEHGNIIPGKILVRELTVGQTERARQEAKCKRGDEEVFDNAKFYAWVIHFGVQKPQIPPIRIEELFNKNQGEIVRLAEFILGRNTSNPPK